MSETELLEKSIRFFKSFWTVASETVETELPDK